MSGTAVSVENLAKVYRIGVQQRHDTLRDRVSHAVSSFRSRGQHHAGPSEFWALNDVSFDLKEGEVLGVIGRNGAGKSTLLKILSRITTPTKGHVSLRGRAGSLLEVGTGFHPELTGRENILLNGAILGMKRSETLSKFDEIVAFSEIGKFLDTPVKRYSSGMYVRLAFAVAAHLEPDILIIDEVLAVGDLAFQKKCLGKIGDVAVQGRTVIFVSHHMPSVLGLCTSAILLDKGRVEHRGSSSEVVERYLSATNESRAERVWPADPASRQPFQPVGMRVCQADGVVTDTLRSSHPFYVEMDYKVTETIPDLRVLYKVYSGMGELLFMSSDVDSDQNYGRFSARQPGHYVSRCHFPANLLNKGMFSIEVSVAIPRQVGLFNDKQAVRFTVDDTGAAGSRWMEERGGFFRPALQWDIEIVQNSGNGRLPGVTNNKWRA